jgi:uncharacterized RDD family membrane protein YckC
METTPGSVNRYAAPVAHVEDVARPQEVLELAGAGARLGAFLIDLIVLMFAGGVCGALLAALGMGRVLPKLAFGNGVSLGFTLVIFLLINGALLARSGQTVGKRLLKLRIVRRDGSPADFARLFGLRYALGWLIGMVPVAGAVYFLVDSLLIFGQARRCLHDRIAGTIVVKA